MTQFVWRGGMKRHLLLALITGIGLAPGCGVDGLTGKLLQIDGASYLIQTRAGEERWIHVDDRTRKDTVRPGEDVHVYVTKDGYAEFVQRVD